MTGTRSTLLLSITLFCISAPSFAQPEALGLLTSDNRALDGYLLLSPLFYHDTYLINKSGEVVHSWEHAAVPSGAVYLLPDGRLLRALADDAQPNFRGRGASLEIVSWEGEIVWKFRYSDSTRALHHDIEPMPNGNVLVTAWELRSEAEAIAAGRDPALIIPAEGVWPEQITELRPILPDSAEVVWQWHVWDHIIQDFDDTKENYGNPDEHPELVDVNFAFSENPDWLHVNSVDYNPELDQIILSTPFLDEFWIIDHSTTMEEASGHEGGRYGRGGDFLYRWSNRPSPDSALVVSHDARWIEPGHPRAGNVMIFLNGWDSTYSRVIEWELPLLEDGSYATEEDGSFSPPTEVWRYMDPDRFFSDYISGALRLTNGHTLIDEGAEGRIFEVTDEGEILWEYVNPVADGGPVNSPDQIGQHPSSPIRFMNSVFRADFFEPDYEGLQGKDLTPEGKLEEVATEGDEIPGILSARLAPNYPNPFSSRTSIEFVLGTASDVTLSIHDVLGRTVDVLVSDMLGPGEHRFVWSPTSLGSGTYYCRLRTDHGTETRSILFLR